MHLRTHRLAVSTVLAVGISLGSTVAMTPARSEPVGVAVPVFRVGAAAGWGDEQEGQSTVPTSLSKAVLSVAAGGYHSLALTSVGRVAVWGFNSNGVNKVPDSLDDQVVTAIAAGEEHSLALTRDGKVTAWGNDAFGKTAVPDSLDDEIVTAIAAGDRHSLALTHDGKVTAWGDPDRGKTTIPPSLDDKTVTAIAAGGEHSLALASDGTVTAWGRSDDGQTTVPVTLTGKTVTAIAAGGHHSLALTSDGTVTGWGYDEYDQASVPRSLDGTTVTAIAAGGHHSLALTSDGTVTGWGYDEDGRATRPAAEVANKVVTAIAAGGKHSLAIATAFAAERNPVISGDPQVGSTLTADAGRYTATPGSLGYEWYADGVALVGATGPQLTLTQGHSGKRITVRVTATLTGHARLVRTSSAVGPVAGAPAVGLTAGKSILRRGEATTLTWTTDQATTLTATGAWTGPRAAAGTIQVEPKTIGASTYLLTGTNALGTTTAQVQIWVTRPDKRLTVTAPKSRLRAGTKVTVKLRGLEAGERYTLRIGKQKVATGTGTRRPLVKRIKLPQKTGKAILRVTGDQPDRTGITKIRVVRR